MNKPLDTLAILAKRARLARHSPMAEHNTGPTKGQRRRQDRQSRKAVKRALREWEADSDA